MKNQHQASQLTPSDRKRWLQALADSKRMAAEMLAEHGRPWIPSDVLLDEARAQRTRQLSLASMSEIAKREGWATLFVLYRTKQGMLTDRYTPAGPGSVLLTTARLIWFRRLPYGGTFKSWWRFRDGITESPTGYIEIALCDIERLSIAEEKPTPRVRLNLGDLFYQLAFQPDEDSVPNSELSVSWFETINQLRDALS